METISRKTIHSSACAVILAVAALLAASPDANAVVTVTSDPFTLFNLEKPTGKFDEPGLSGFEYLLSDRAGEYRANDQYLIAGEESLPSTSLVADLGGVAELSGVSLDFSIEYNLLGGRNFTFSIDDPLTGLPSVLCWGGNCPVGSNAAQTIDGRAPISRFNGLQIQVRAQEVDGASIMISSLAMTGVDMAPGSAALFDGTVTPETPSTIPFDPAGRIAQWLLGDSLDLVVQEWALSGTVTILRDMAVEDLTKVRLAVDLVNDLRLPLQPVPLPASAWFFGASLAGLIGLKRRK